MSTNQVQTNWPLRKPQQLVYIELGPDNGGMVLGICEQGLSFRAVAPLKSEGPVYFTFALDGKTRLNGAGEIAWSEDGGKSGGLKFTNISQQFRETLQEWLKSEATPKSIGREVTPAAALPLDSLPAPKSRTQPDNAISIEEVKPAAPSVPSEARPAAPKPIIPAPDTRPTSPVSIESKPHEEKHIEPKPAEPKRDEAKPVGHMHSEQLAREVEAEVQAPASPLKIKPKSVEAKPVEHIHSEQLAREVEAKVQAPASPLKIEPKFIEAKPEPPKPESLKPIEAPRAEPVSPEHELRTAASHLPAAETRAEPIFSLPNYRLPSAEIAPPATLEKPAAYKPHEAKPEPAAVERPTPQTLPPEPAAGPLHELQHKLQHELPQEPSHELRQELQRVVEPEPRRLIPPPANPDPWDLPAAKEGSEEIAEEPPGVNRAAAATIISLALAVLLAALVISLRREIGEALIRLGESVSGEERKQVVPQQPAQAVVPAQNTPAPTQTQTPVDQSAGQTTNTGTAQQSSAPTPQQGVSENPSAANLTSANSTPTNVVSSNTVRQIQDLPPPKDGGSGQKEFEQARNMLKGNRRQRDLPSAVDLLWTAVGKGYVRAEVTLADLYARGDGVPKSCAQARLLLQAAIQKGSPEARRRLDQLKRQGCP